MDRVMWNGCEFAEGDMVQWIWIHMWIHMWISWHGFEPCFPGTATRRLKRALEIGLAPRLRNTVHEQTLLFREFVFAQRQKYSPMTKTFFLPAAKNNDNYWPFSLESLTLPPTPTLQSAT